MNPSSISHTPRVLHLVISLAHGGLERLVVDWTNARNRACPASTSICCLDAAGELASQVESGDVAVLAARRMRFPCDVGAVIRLRRLLRTTGSGVLHSHNAAAWQYGVLACLGLPVRHIHTEHGTNPHCSGPVNRLRNTRLWRMTDELVAVAASVAADLSVKQGIPASRIRVVANGLDVGRYAASGSGKTETRRTLGIPPEAKVVGSVGRLAPVKGYDRLIRAFAELSSGQGDSSGAGVTPPRQYRPEVRPAPGETPVLLLVGDGPERFGLETLAQSLGIADRVFFAGYQPDPAPYLQAMDLFVLPSRSEGLSMSLLEAMATGVPVAVTDVGSNRELVEGGRCGGLLPPDEAAWAVAIGTALADGERTRMRCDAARSRVASDYSMEATLAAYERLYAIGPGT